MKLIPQLSESDKTRFWSKVKIAGPDECWEWTAGKHCRGYGQFGIGRSMFLSHRISYVLANGEFTEDKPHTLHSCDNRLCQNPAHLSAGTNADNVQDMVKKGRGPSGDKNGSRTKPECLIRGEATCTAKLTGTQVVEIRNIYSQGKLSQLKLAKKFGVSQSIIYLIVNRKRWAHIP